MRPLRVRLAAPAAVAVACVAALGAAAPVAVHPGDTITDRQLFAYLSLPVEAGDWVRYRVVFADRSTAMKTIGFGTESVAGTRTLFVETHVSTQAVTGLPAETAVGIGTDAVLKTYVAGAAFGDLAHPYTVITSALKVGAMEYEVSPGAGQTYSALAGTAVAQTRTGTIRSVQPVDLHVGSQTLHTVHIVASFDAAPLPVGGVALAYTLEVWQSPDAPLGTVAISSGGSHRVEWRLVAYGRGGYRSLFSKTLDQIRQTSKPTMP